jgi:hypothetical protein
MVKILGISGNSVGILGILAVGILGMNKPSQNLDGP